jgi:hypothetical protein
MRPGKIEPRAIKEHDVVVLTRDVPEHGLVAGDTGVVVDVAPDGGGYLLEIFALDGSTIEVVGVGPGDVRAARRNEVSHARPVAAE